ncbi:MAG: HEAT repeat domain-containing protein [Acidobacteriia bacterium]|nr:HEAT repeat domain-containing protein [Terriglobia bacterium]
MKIASLLLGCVCLGLSLLGPPAAPAQGPSRNEDLTSPDANKRAKAAHEVAKSSDPASIATLTKLLSDSSPKVRREAVLGLSSIRSPQVLDPLITATRDQDEKVRSFAIEGLTGYYSGQRPSGGLVGLWQKSVQRVRRRFTEDTFRVDPGVPVDPKVLTALVAAMNEAALIQPAREAANALGVLVAREAVPDLVKTAHSPDGDLAVEALTALCKIQDRSVGPQLVDLLDSEHKDVMRQAAVTVGILKTQDAVAKLQSLYENGPDKATRARALEGLAYLGSPTSEPIFLKALWSSEDELRVYAAEGLGRAGEAGALPDLEKALLADKSAEARLAIAFAITSLGKMDHLSDLVAELDTRLRGDAAQAYLVELARKPDFLPRLYPSLDSDRAGVRRGLCLVLMYAGDKSSIPPLEKLSQDKNTDVATDALRALRAVRQRAE